MILDARLGVLMRSDEPPGQVFDLVTDTGVVYALGVCLDLPAGARVRGGSVRTLVRELKQWANTGTDVEIPDVAKRTAAIVCGEWSPEQTAEAAVALEVEPDDVSETVRRRIGRMLRRWEDANPFR